jgi:two-component system, sensor histidine kinase and response regulator
MSGSILIVDDTVYNLKILSQILTQHGYQVHQAMSGEMALEAASLHYPDLILLDVAMPVMNGYEVCQNLKADETTRSIPVIFISALNDLQDKVRGFEAGGVDYITKPFQIREVLARVQSHITVAQQRREIERLSTLKDELVRVVSHDLTNPISIIQGYIDLMYEEVAACGPTGEMLQEWMRSITHAADHMLSIVSDLLDLARIEEGIPLSREPVLLLEMLRSDLAMFYILAQDKQITLVPNFPDAEITVHLDRTRFRQVAHNLLSNAIKYTPEGGHIRVSVQADTDQVVLRFQDDGFGIPAEDLPHIFDKFYRVQSEKHLRAKGTGLGLAVTQGIVQQHGGNITVESESGVGTTFSITLPLV